MGRPDNNLWFVDGSVRTYGAATRDIMDVYKTVVGRPMDRLPRRPKDRFRKALGYLVEAMERDHADRLRDELDRAARDDEAIKSMIDDTMGSQVGEAYHDIDDIPPSVFKDAIWHVAFNYEGEKIRDVCLGEFLRTVVSQVMQQMGWTHRINVGNNRHFPRMVQWLREVELETTWDDGTGVRLMNCAGAGRVAAFPEGPDNLMVRLNRDWL